uniref:Transcription initiation factor TFIID component TAF4 C-terminal domain-containing protein n=1 Tax=Chrysemys picta bellii TaxID=8478 RepID=A0A8C3F6I7_CHRPI
MAAGASDPLEEMLLFSEEVDEKAVSDLVGSLESQLAGGRGSAEGPPPNSSPPSHQQQEHQGSLVEGGSPVQQQQQGHPAPPHFPGAGETARCPSAVGSPPPAQGAPPALSPSAAAAAGRGASVNSSSMQQSHGAAPCSSNPSAPAAPVPLQSAAPPPPVGAPAQPVSNHVDANAAAPAVGSGAREVESPRHGCSPPAAAAGAVNSVLLLNSEAATAGGSPEAAGAVTPVAAAAASRELAKAVMLSSTAAAPPPALSLLQRPALHSVPPAAHSGNGTSSSAPVVVTQSLKAGCAPAAITQVVNHQNPAVSHSKPDSSTAQTKLLTHNPAVNALSNSTSSVPTMNLVTHPAQSSVANCAPVVSSPITLTAISKPTVNIIGPPGSAVGVAKSATAVPVVSAVPQSLSPRPAVGTAQRIVAPQLIVRPPQQTTIQLPPGFTIPPGMVLVRTEAGQLVMVPQQVLAQAQVQAQVQTQGQGPASISPRLSVPTSGPVFRLTTTQIIQSTSAQTAKRNPACQTTQIRMPVVITQTIRPQGTVGKAPTIQASQSPGGFGVQVSANQKNKLNDPGGGSFRDDDDINDVASMAGVNLNEESARIMATNSDLVGTQIQSCKDEPFLAAIPLHKRILEMAKKLGITDVPTEVVTFISHATQNRLRTVIEKVTMVTQHRMESHKDDEWYEQATDVRSQLKFFEQLEHLEKQRKDEQEREILLKAAKSRSRQEDPEQARLKQKAKEMQQQELAQMRQRDANLTALAAIGPRKKRKLDSAGLLTIGGEVLGMTSGSQAGFGAPSSRQYARQKITRVNLRDFIFYMEQERETSHSLLLYRALLK